MTDDQAVPDEAVAALAAWMREWKWITDLNGRPLPDDWLQRVCAGAASIVLEAATERDIQARVGAAIAAATKAEREACAQFAERHGAIVPVWHQTSAVSGRYTYEPFADLIRARTTP